MIKQLSRARVPARLVCAVVGAMAAGMPVWGRQAPPAAPVPETVSFESLDTKLPAGGVKLANGTVVTDLSDWKAIAVSEEAGSTDAKPLFCTVTLVGPQVLATAAHCVWSLKTNSRKVVTVFFTNSPYVVVDCAVPDAYKTSGASGQDFAFCELKKPVVGVRPETLDNVDLVDDGTITLMGYGCSAKRLDANNEKLPTFDPRGHRLLRHGAARVFRTGVGDLPDEPGQLVLVLSAPKQPTLCPGDSGGPAWRDMSPTAPAKGRLITALNVREGQGPTDETGTSWYSYLLPTGSLQVQTFLKAWVGTRLPVCLSADPKLASGVDCRT